ncbi:MAG: hypothetical protein HKN13_03245 [Rhodothermales bacterium]|nr:hypothetical protein [Rhodothermales bacterium]
MRLNKLASLVLVATLVVGCTSDMPTTFEVQDSGTSELAKNGATHSSTTLVFDTTGDEFELECFDGVATSIGKVDFLLTTVTTPSGLIKTTWKGLYSYRPYGFTVDGHTYDLVKASQVAQEKVSDKTAWSDHFSINEWYENEIGELYHMHGVYSVRLDAVGNIAFERFHGWCPGTPDAEFSFF